MSSVLQIDSPNLPITKFVPIRSMCYYDNEIGHDVLIPFSYNEGVLDIHVQDDAQTMIDNGDSFNGTNGYNWRMVKMMGGDGLVTSLGTNFTSWLSNWIENEFDPLKIITPFTLVTNPVMTRVQQCVQNSGNGPINSQYAIRFSTEPPMSDDYIIAGNSNNNFFSSWVYKTPITVEFTFDGSNVPSYATLSTQFQNPNSY